VNDGPHSVSLVDKKGNDAGVLRFHVNGHGLFGSREGGRTSGYETGRTTGYETGTGIGAAGVGTGIGGATHGSRTTGWMCPQVLVQEVVFQVVSRCVGSATPSWRIYSI
jgi:hypothetical protein